MDAMAKAAQRLAGKSETAANEIASFLRDVDVPISKLKVEILELPEVMLSAVNRLADTESKLITGATPSRTRTVLTHKTALGDADLEYQDESEGTKNLIGFWLPWVIKDPSYGAERLLIVDELDSSLHPKIVMTLVEKHLNSSIPSQLIFTTHDTHLMDTKLLRRDQFWITERDMNGATQLRSIHDFEGRESEDIEKRYYEGRYRGLPFVKRIA